MNVSYTIEQHHDHQLTSLKSSSKYIAIEGIPDSLIPKIPFPFHRAKNNYSVTSTISSLALALGFMTTA